MREFHDCPRCRLTVEEGWIRRRRGSRRRRPPTPRRRTSPGRGSRDVQIYRFCSSHWLTFWQLVFLILTIRVLSFATCARISDRGINIRNAVAPKEVVQDDDSDGGDRGQCSSDGPDAADNVPGLGRLPAVSGMAFNGACVSMYCILYLANFNFCHQSFFFYCSILKVTNPFSILTS